MIKAPRYSLREGNELFFNPITVGDNLIKTASDMQKYSPEVASFASSIKPKDGSQYVLINAVSAYEYWGCNINADAFKEEEFTVNKRHETFMTHAHPYRNHVNKDPNISYGKVLFATYNPRMHRVELVCEYDRKKADDICKRIDDLEDVRVSMGCRVAYDVCSICGNKAKTSAEYCDHLKGQLKKIMPDGRVVCAFNPNPTFFDISVVWVPADKTARILYKIASEGIYKNVGGLWLPEQNSIEAAKEHGYSEGLVMEKESADKMAGNKIAELAKKAVHKKLSEIEKDIPAEPIGRPTEEELKKVTEESLPALRESEPEIPNEKLDVLAEEFPLGKILSALGMLGILPKPKEFQRMFLVSHGRHDIADMFDRNGISFESSLPSVITAIRGGIAPSVDDCDMPESMESDNVLSSIIPMLGNLIGEKSYYATPAVKRIIKITIVGRPKVASDEQPKESLIGSMKGYLTALAVAYLYTKARTLNLITTAAGMTGGSLDRAFIANPELGAALLGAGGLGLSAALRGGMSHQGETSTAYPSDYLYAKPGTYTDKSACVKYASIVTPGQANLISALTMGQLATHLTKGYVDADERAEYNRGVMPSKNPIKDLIKNYPGYLGLALSAGALYKGLI